MISPEPMLLEAEPGATEFKTPLNVLVVVPVYNGGALWREAAKALAVAQSFSRHRVRVKVVDSSSADDSVHTARAHGFEVSGIDSRDFDHCGTRNAAVLESAALRQGGGQASAADAYVADVYVFLTQDAILDPPNSLDILLDAFRDPEVVIAWGRQLPHHDANPIASHARHFNYGEESRVVGLQDRARYGIKTVFTSNSFSAYRASVFNALGGFPESTILSEDMYYAARAVLQGGKVAYVANACVRHSHNYGPLEEFRRYFDIGVFQADHAWIEDHFGGAEGEGLRFVKSEVRTLMRRAPLWLPRAMLHDALKILGFRLGRSYRRLPEPCRPWFSMHRGYWKKYRPGKRNNTR